MRLHSVELVRFGEFRDQPPVSGLRPGLNVFCAANEVGKSTLLGALRYGLFGAEVKDYRPADGGREVRLELWRDDALWRLHRREGAGGASFKLTRADGLGTVLQPEFVAQWLTGVSLSLYQSLYALALDDLQWHDKLRDLLMLAESGRLGVDLRRLAREMEAAADGQYTQKSSTKPLDAALTAWKRAGDEVRRLAEQPREFEQKTRHLGEAERELADLEQQFEVARREHEAAVALVSAWPQWERLVAARRRAEELAAVAEFPPTAPDEFAAARAAERAAAEEHQAADQARLAAADELARVTVDELLLGAAEDVERLRRRAEQLSAWPTQRDDALRQAQTEREQAAAEARARCGEGATVERLAELDASVVVRGERDARQQQMQTAQRAADAAAERRRAAADQLAQATASRQSAEQALEQLPEPLDEAPLLQRRRALDQQPELSGRLHEAETTAGAARVRLADLEQRRRSETAAAEQAEQARQANQAKLAAAQSSATAPARARWLVVAAAGLLLAYGVYALTAQQELTGGINLVVGVLLLLYGLGGAAVNVVLPTIELALPALGTVADADLEQAQAAVQAADEAVSVARGRLTELAQAAGLSSEATREQWQAARDQAAAELGQAEDHKAQRLAAERALIATSDAQEAAERRLAQAEGEAEQAQQALAEVTAGWAAWLLERGLDAGLSPEAARVWLDAAQVVRQQRQAAAQAEATSAARERDLAEARQAAQELAGRLERSWDDTDPWGLRTATEWAEQLAAAREAQRRREHLQQARDEAEQRLTGAEATLATAREEQAQTLQRAGAADEDELRNRARLAAELSDVAQELRTVEAALRGAREDEAWNAWQQALAGADRAALEQRSDASAAQRAELDQQLAALREQVVLLRRDLQELRTEGALAAALLAREQAKAEVARQAEEWAVYRAAQVLLELTLRRHEAQRQPERIARIGHLLAQLSDGRWDGVVVRDRELWALREGGRVERKTDQLSRGTRDALFLCARLAALEQQLERCRLPVAFDDTLVNLDQRRRPRMLQMIGALAEQTQVLYFTCHETVPEQLRQLGIAAHEVELA